MRRHPFGRRSRSAGGGLLGPSRAADRFPEDAWAALRAVASPGHRLRARARPGPTERAIVPAGAGRVVATGRSGAVRERADQASRAAGRSGRPGAFRLRVAPGLLGGGNSPKNSGAVWEGASASKQKPVPRITNVFRAHGCARWTSRTRGTLTVPPGGAFFLLLHDVAHSRAGARSRGPRPRGRAHLLQARR